MRHIGLIAKLIHYVRGRNGGVGRGLCAENQQYPSPQRAAAKGDEQIIIYSRIGLYEEYCRPATIRPDREILRNEQRSFALRDYTSCIKDTGCHRNGKTLPENQIGPLHKSGKPFSKIRQTLQEKWADPISGEDARGQRTCLRKAKEEDSSPLPYYIYATKKLFLLGKGHTDAQAIILIQQSTE